MGVEGLHPYMCVPVNKVIKGGYWLEQVRYHMGDGWAYARGLFIIVILDGLISDDEPLWEPLEWSLLQIWLLWIFIFAWIGENLITSRFGSYTGRDKRVWSAWYKSFWGILIWYQLSLAAAALFVIVPFYYEITYQLAFVISWWNWYSRVFFFRFLGFFCVIGGLGQLLVLSNRVFSWQKMLLIVGIVLISCFAILYGQFIVAFFAYFTDPLWYQKVRFIDSIQLSHEPLKWGWGGSKRDHFTYHKVSTVFWFKADNPFGGVLMLFHLVWLLVFFFIVIYLLALFRRIYVLGEVSFSFLVYNVSTLRQLTWSLVGLYGLVGFSYLSNYWRFPIELNFNFYTSNLFDHIVALLLDMIF